MHFVSWRGCVVSVEWTVHHHCWDFVRSRPTTFLPRPLLLWSIVLGTIEFSLCVRQVLRLLWLSKGASCAEGVVWSSCTAKCVLFPPSVRTAVVEEASG